MNKYEENFVVFLQLVETENSYCDIQIRFYLDREENKKEQTLWGNIERFGNSTLWIYI